MSANAGTFGYLGAAQCPSPCPFTGVTTAHHDQLLMVDRDMEQALSLVELAVTWGELDYSRAPLIGPSQWPDFVATHCWHDRARAQRLFGLAVDAARQSVRANLACIG